MRYILFIGLIMICIPCFNQGNTMNFNKNKQECSIYVSSSIGNDNNNGTSKLTPLKTLNKAISIVKNGQTIGIKANDTIYESISIVNKNNLILRKYGTGANPIILAYKIINGWTNVSGNIWSSTNSNYPLEVRDVYFASTKGILARTPKASFNTATSGTMLSLTDTNLGLADGYYSGAELVMQLYVWWTKVIRIQTFATNTFNYNIGDYDSYFTVVNGCKYFVQNHVNCITTTNEWAYDATTKTVYIYSSGAPSNISIAYYSTLLSLNYCNNITIQNIHFVGSSDNIIYINNSSNITIQNNNLEKSGKNGIEALFSKNIVIKNDSIVDNNNNGLYFLNCGNVKVINNYVYKSHSIFGTARFENEYPELAGYVGKGMLFAACNKVEAFYNTISTVGYSGIIFHTSNGVNIHHNYIYDFCKNMSDGGAIYTNKNNPSYNWLSDYPFVSNKINYNVIYRPYTLSSNTNGLYIDDNSSYIEAKNNTIVNCSTGIIIKGDHHLVYNNSVIAGGTANPSYGIWFYRYQPPPMYGDSTNCKNNTVVMQYDNSYPCYGNYITNIASHNVIDSNKYYFPFGSASTNIYFGANGSTIYTLAQWISNWGQSHETIITPSLFANSVKPKTNYLYPILNGTKNNKIINLSDLPYSDYIKLDGTTPSYPITIKPYESLILVRTQ